MPTLTQRSFSSGEIAPALRARADLAKYATGLSACRNFYVKKAGGIESRPGTQWVGQCNFQARTVRLIPFTFDLTQSYVIELGHLYIRIIYDGGYVVNATKTITAATKANPCVVTAENHGFANGDIVYISNVGGMVELNGRFFEVNGKVDDGVGGAPDTFQLKSCPQTTAADGANVNSTSYTTYTSGGTVVRTLAVVSPFTESDLAAITYAQSGDTITFCHPSYNPRNLTRSSHTGWSLAVVASGPTLGAPTTITVGDLPTGTPHKYLYKITAVKANNEESRGQTSGTGARDIVPDDDAIALSQAMVQIGATGVYRFETGGGGGVEYFNGVLASSGAFNKSYGVILTITNTTTTTDLSGITFQVTGVSMDGIDAVEESNGPRKGGTIAFANFWKRIDGIRAFTDPVVNIKAGVQSASYFPLNVVPSSVTDAVRYRLYRSNVDGVFGYVAEANATTGLLDEGGSPDFTVSPPTAPVNFALSSGNYPSSVGYYQQRIVMAASTNRPENIWMSRIGLYGVVVSGTQQFVNMDTTFPVQADNAIDFSIASRQVNRVRHLLDIGRLIVFTESGEWLIEGDVAGIITPTQINPRQFSYYGSGTVPPIPIGSTAVFVQRGGGIVRDLTIEVQSDGYRGNDLSVFASHLFEGETVGEWTYAKSPDSLIWMARSGGDGTFLCLSYLEEHQVYGWSRHDIQGATVSSVCAIPGTGAVDDVYILSHRTVNGVIVKSVERLAQRFFLDPDDYVCLDSSLGYDGTNTTSKTMTLTTGTTWVAGQVLGINSSSAHFSSADVGKGVFFPQSDGSKIRIIITTFVGASAVLGVANVDIPVALQGVATTNWADAVKTLVGLWHLEGLSVGVWGDSRPVASPNNPAYAAVTVTNGSITLAAPYSVIRVGLPITCDMETLDIDRAEAEVKDSKKLVTTVTLHVERSARCWVGSSEPTGLTSLTGLHQLDMSGDVGNVATTDGRFILRTGTQDVNIRPEWNSNGRVFLRHVDPIPLTVLAASPSVLTAPRGQEEQNGRRA